MSGDIRKPICGDPLRIVWQDEAPLDHIELVDLLKEFGDLLPSPLSQRTELPAYAQKIMGLAHIGRAMVGERTEGLVLVYANDRSSRRGHIPLLAVRPSLQGRGIGKALLSRALARCRQQGMHEVDLEVDEANLTAVRLYAASGFRAVDRQPPKLRMLCALPPLLPIEGATPVEQHQRLADALELDIDLRLKRDDLYPVTGGGIKARKIRYIVREAIDRGHDVIVTNGGPQSNHARATALLCGELGLRCHLVIVLEAGRHYPDTGNILMMRLSGATIEFCEKHELAERMDTAVSAYKRLGHDPLYVWGGGHGVPGTVAFVDAAAESIRQCENWSPEYVILASGTGSTQAGLSIGYGGAFTRVIGISVARDARRGAEVVRQCIKAHFEQRLSAPCCEGDVRVEFLDDWTDGGYEKTSGELLDIVKRAAAVGVLIDPTYSGKALRGLADLARRGDIPRGARVLFWHTGGLLNLQACELAGGTLP